MQYLQAKVPSAHHPTLTQALLGALITALLLVGVLTALGYIIMRGYTGFVSKLIPPQDLQLVTQKEETPNNCASVELGTRIFFSSRDASEMQGPRPELVTSIRLGMISDVHDLLRSQSSAENYTATNEVDSALGMTPLEYAASIGDQNIVMLLLLHGAEASDSNTSTVTRRGLAPIWWALKGSSESQKGETRCQEIVRLLLEKGADHRATPDFPQPRKLKSPLLAPIHLAAKLGYAGVVGVLLEHDRNHVSSDTGSIMTIQDSDGFSSLHHAAKQGHSPAVELLLTKGANIECRDKRGNTPLQIASREGNTAVVNLLLDQGADIEAKNDDAGSTPLHCTARYREEGVVRILLSRGASIFATDSSGQKPLHWAAQHGHDSVVGILLQHMHGCDAGTGRRYNIDETDKEGKTALHLASGNGHATVVTTLLDHGADAKVTDNYLKTPLHYACTSPFGRKPLVEELLDHGAEIDAKDDSFTTPLHFAVTGPLPGMRSRGDVHVVKLLLERGADFEAEDAGGKRPLHLAVPLRYLPTEDPYSKLVTKYLLRKGAMREAKDRGGKTAMELAREGEYWEVCRILGKGSQATAA